MKSLLPAIMPTDQNQKPLHRKLVTETPVTAVTVGVLTCVLMRSCQTPVIHTPAYVYAVAWDVCVCGFGAKGFTPSKELGK